MRFQLSKTILTIAFSVIFLINFSGCATMNKSECTTANWEIIGLEDGSAGRNTSYIGEHRQACSEHNVAPDLEQYMKGHAAGLRQFCTENNGYQQGAKGAQNNNICPANLAGAFQRGYKKGYRVYQMESQINQLRRSIDGHEYRLKEISEITASRESELINRNTPEYRRRELLSEIKELERESEATHIEIDEMRVALLRAEEDYQRLLYNQGR